MKSCPSKNHGRGSNTRLCNNVCVVDDVRCLSESVKVKDMHSQKVKVISREGQNSSVRQLSRAFYSKNASLRGEKLASSSFLSIHQDF